MKMMLTQTWETIHGPSLASVNITSFKTTKLNSEINTICKMRSRRLISNSMRHSYEFPCYVKRDVEEEFKQFAEPSIRIIDHECKSMDKAIPVDISYQKDFMGTEDDICVLRKCLLTNRRNLKVSHVSVMHHITKFFVDNSFNLLRIGTLTAAFSFQDYYQALATTEIATVVQSGSWLGDLGDISTGFTSAFLLIFFSELGDKTFFIAALLASRKSGAPVFFGTFGALAVMTIISVFLGRTFHYVDDILQFRLGQMELPLDDLAAVGLLVYFGVSTLLEAGAGDESKASDEQEEAELAIAGLSGDSVGILAGANTVISTFGLVFVAEWGDKSFFSTIALAAASSPLGVVVGAIAAHGVATLIAVLGGSLLGTYVSEKVITYTGGVLFLVFAATTLFEIFM